MKNSIVNINAGFSEVTGKHHFSMYNGSTEALTSLDGVEFEGTIFVKLHEACAGEWNKRHADFIKFTTEVQGGDSKYRAVPIATKEAMLEMWTYKDMLTPAKLALAQKVWSFKELKEFLTKRHEKHVKRRIADNLAHLQEVEKAGGFESIEISVEWKKSRMWGANPSAEARVNGERRREFFTGSASGCGYDKESAAIAEALNQSPALLRALYVYKEEHGAAEKNHTLFGYGSGYGVLPQFEGGVGVSCYPEIFKKIGYSWRNVGSGKSFDVYNVSRITETK